MILKNDIQVLLNFCKIITFHFNKKLTLSTILQIKKTSFPAYFSNLEGSALFQPQNKKVEYLSATQFLQVSYHLSRISISNHKIQRFSRSIQFYRFQDFY